MPDAPTGIALASALKVGGPLITSIGISVGGGGVKTTVKMDLYTSSFGKLQKQKEMSISQVARERQRTLDEKNSAIRRGLGKRQTSSDLVNTVMQAGGQIMADQATNIANQLITNDNLGKDIQETHIAVGPDGGTTLTTESLQRKLEQGATPGQFANTVIQTVNSAWRVISTIPNSLLASEVPDRVESTSDRIIQQN